MTADPFNLPVRLDPVAENLRSELATLAYEDLGSVTEAAVLREKTMAAAELAKRAGVDEHVYRRLAREAERTLGQMLLAAREAGHIAGEGRPKTMRDVHSLPNLDDLGVEPHLAADAVLLARLPDDWWTATIPEAPSRAALVRAARNWLTELETSEATLEQAIEEAKTEREAAEEELARLQALPPHLILEPLTVEELVVSGAGMELHTVIPEPEPGLDKSRDAAKQRQVVKEIQALTDLLDEHDPYLFNDVFRGLKVLAARDAMSRMLNSATVWMRTLNAMYEDALREEQPDD